MKDFEREGNKITLEECDTDKQMDGLTEKVTAPEAKRAKRLLLLDPKREKVQVKKKS